MEAFGQNSKLIIFLTSIYGVKAQRESVQVFLRHVIPAGRKEFEGRYQLIGTRFLPNPSKFSHSPHS